MTRSEAKKRLIRIKGIPLKPTIEPRAEVRRGSSKVEYVNEYESEFANYFDFDEDLLEMEAARKQVERIAEEKILYENRMRKLGIDPDSLNKEESFVSFSDDDSAEDEDL